MTTITLILMIALGGSLGALLRYAFGELARVWRGLPGWVAILAANLLGCALIGLFFALLDSPEASLTGGEAPGPAASDPTLLRAFLITGFCGSLTTFSTFSRDTIMLYYEGRPGLLGLNVGGSVVGGLVGTALALTLGGLQ